MAELIVDGAAQTVDLAPFNPGRMPRLDPARLRMSFRGGSTSAGSYFHDRQMLTIANSLTP